MSIPSTGWNWWASLKYSAGRGTRPNTFLFNPCTSSSCIIPRTTKARAEEYLINKNNMIKKANQIPYPRKVKNVKTRSKNNVWCSSSKRTSSPLVPVSRISIPAIRKGINNAKNVFIEGLNFFESKSRQI